MAIKGFQLGGGVKETTVSNISTTKRFPIERADNAKVPPMTREERDVWDTDDPVPTPAAAPVTVSKAPTPLRAELEAQLAKKRAMATATTLVRTAVSPMRAALEAELAQRQTGGPPVRRAPPPRYASPYRPGSMDPPENVGAGTPPPGGIKVR